jgi:hypothetical protein
MVPRVTDVKIRQFWTKNMTDVPSLSFHIAHVPRMKKMKTEGAKNKFFRPHEAKKYLILKNIDGN